MSIDKGDQLERDGDYEAESDTYNLNLTAEELWAAKWLVSRAVMDRKLYKLSASIYAKVREGLEDMGEDLVTENHGWSRPS